MGPSLRLLAEGAPPHFAPPPPSSEDPELAIQVMPTLYANAQELALTGHAIRLAEHSIDVIRDADPSGPLPAPWRHPHKSIFLHIVLAPPEVQTCQLASFRQQPRHDRRT